ncbi:hypothetical protein [Cohnella luojiensis]|uniref:Uncharacterized protein n=1 Tax=Cohnella luojiensis TaxID=652876 RepID=A0A4Y8LN55_9BACL|nr:hypothetical protein [Cohnella luojiensis]TFE19660.1 hypothetical protein E2980_22520 [Cohnella luojiensis]
MKIMIIKIISMLVLLLCVNPVVLAKEVTMVSVFDVKQEKVVKVIPLTPELNDSVLQLLQSSPTIYGGFGVNPTSGIVLHIPFPKPVRIPHECYPHPIKEVYLFLAQGTKPLALLFLDNNRQNIVELDYDVQKKPIIPWIKE